MKIVLPPGCAVIQVFSIVLDMAANRSPWTEQLSRHRPPVTLTTNHQTDVVVVGAGIAGITTAYFLLQESNYDVTVIEAGLAAHGATGHNAGQLVSYFEQQLSELAKVYGLPLAAQAQEAVNSAWTLLDQIRTHTKITTPLALFTGYAGCQDIHELIIHLENIICAQEAGLQPEPVIIKNDPQLLNKIPAKYHQLYTTAPHGHIMELLETNNPEYIAALSARKGCMNSALFCEDLIAFMQQSFPNRFRLFEHSPMTEVNLHHHHAELGIGAHVVTAARVVLCTNGFERFTIKNHSGDDIDKNFHHLVRGTVGYMAGYVEDSTNPPTAISYLPNHDDQLKKFQIEPYFYLTRRPIFSNGIQTKNLICIGGPEARMDDTNGYHKEHPYPAEAQKAIDTFLHTTYKHAPTQEIEYSYQWHGLMGYTPNGLRCIGPEPINSTLLYNLGCNGVGILPSIYGSMKISQLLTGKKLPPSIFDPQDYRKKP